MGEIYSWVLVLWLACMAAALSVVALTESRGTQGEWSKLKEPGLISVVGVSSVYDHCPFFPSPSERWLHFFLFFSGFVGSVNAQASPVAQVSLFLPFHECSFLPPERADWIAKILTTRQWPWSWAGVDDNLLWTLDSILMIPSFFKVL